MKLTLIDYAILGLLQEKPLSGYAIRKLFEQTGLANYSSSPGTIYPALKRLEKFKLVKKSTEEKSGKIRFEITRGGTQILKGWFLKPIEKNDVMKNTNELLLRFAFMEELVDKKQAITFLTSFRESLKSYIKELQSFYDNETDTMPLHGRVAFQHGIDSRKTTLRWCNKAISQLT